MTSFVLCYDIREPRRLQRIHRVMIRHATPIEYSIFLLEGGAGDVQGCLDEVLPIMHDEDDVRCYGLPVWGLQLRLGRPVLPEGILWTGLPAAVV